MGPLLALLAQNPGLLAAVKQGAGGQEGNPFAGLLGGGGGNKLDIFKQLPLPDIPDMPYGWNGGSMPLLLLTSRIQ